MRFDFDDENKIKTEEQRYKEIKEKGNYIEVDILIDSSEDDYNNKLGKQPIVTTIMSGCSSQDIAAMYLTLKAMIKQFEETYPVECILGATQMDATYLGSTKIEKIRKPRED